jgi:hypothetical protein
MTASRPSFADREGGRFPQELKRGTGSLPICARARVLPGGVQVPRRVAGAPVSGLNGRSWRGVGPLGISSRGGPVYAQGAPGQTRANVPPRAGNVAARAPGRPRPGEGHVQPGDGPQPLRQRFCGFNRNVRATALLVVTRMAMCVTPGE